ncbi:MAG: hypothetical protein C4563_01715 [Desulfobulbus sp.]|nr:MAG: hypothetical protein C4563_01715 [Desulfobulbus sp.]
MAEQQPENSIPPARKALFAALTATMALLAALILGEIAARLFFRGGAIPAPPPAREINPYRANPYIVNMRPYLYFHIPGAHYFQKIGGQQNEYRINSMGFRGPEIPPLPRPGTRRLLVLGDSIVEGHGVRFTETLSHHLGKKLAPHRWEVINLGVQGASPLYYAANLERYLFLRPDAILILLHENDLRDDELRAKSYFSSPLLGDRAGLYSGGEIHSPAAASKLYPLLANTWRTFFPSPLEKIIAVDAGATDKSTNNAARRAPSFSIPPEKFAERWAMSSAYLAYLLDSLRRREVTVLVSSLSTVTLAFPALPHYAAFSAKFDNQVKDWATGNKIPHLSLIPTMKQALADHRLKEVLIVNDYHPTAMTHERLAEALHPFLLANLPAANGTGSGRAE